MSVAILNPICRHAASGHAHRHRSRQALLEDIRFARSIGGNSFPSLFLQRNGAIHPIPHHYTDSAEVLRSIEAGLAE